MTGHKYGDHEPVEKCPYCGTYCRADFVDIGVGFQQCGPYHCEECGASQIGPYDEDRSLTPQEKETCWYAPKSPPGSSANVVGGKIVSYVQALAAYRAKFHGNPLWHDKAYVRDFWDRQRK